MLLRRCGLASNRLSRQLPLGQAIWSLTRHDGQTLIPGGRRFPLGQAIWSLTRHEGQTLIPGAAVRPGLADPRRSRQLA